MARILRTVIRSSAFVSKEILEILRQPRLIVTLVLGPFLILLLFGVGYRAEEQSLRTILVVQATNPLRQEIEQRAQHIGPPIIYLGSTTDQAQALDKLRRGELDLVVVAPPDIYQSIRNNQQAVFTLYHNEINPFQVDYINYLGQLYGSDLNRQVAVSLTGQAQTQVPQALKDIAAARASAQAMVTFLRAGNTSAAKQQQQALAQSLDSSALTLGASIAILSALGQSGGDPAASGDPTSQLAAARQDANALPPLLNDGSAPSAGIPAAQKTDQDLANLQSSLQEFGSISSNVLVSPFKTESKDVSSVQPQLVSYYTPAVIALMLQHLMLTFAALSIVREYRMGTMELFRVSPLSAIETLVGKYLGYMIFGGALGAILTALMITGLGVQMLGDWRAYAGVLAALLFASLGVGFVLSLLAETESQAVQYSMIFLLTSVFFSGFFLSVASLWQPVRVVSYLLPVTYAMPTLQAIMLRGTNGNPLFIAALVGMGVVALLLAWLLLKRKMSVAG